MSIGISSVLLHRSHRVASISLQPTLICFKKIEVSNMVNAEMNYHSGYIESCHCAKENVSWYIENQHSEDFCHAVQSGDFIPCGTSGDGLFYFAASVIDCAEPSKCPKGYRCCCFVFGHNCLNDVLRRRWSCCKQELTCKFEDMITIKGCCRLTRNITK
jgi:hypothetical protein